MLQGPRFVTKYALSHYSKVSSQLHCRGAEGGQQDTSWFQQRGGECLVRQGPTTKINAAKATTATVIADCRRQSVHSFENTLAGNGLRSLEMCL